MTIETKTKAQQLAEKYRENYVRFMTDLIAIPSESSEEEGVAKRIKKEMEDLGYDKVWIDDYGNPIGQIGNGPIKVMYDSHIDTVGIGNRDMWNFDPYQAQVNDGYIYGRGASDNHNGTIPQVYGAAIWKEMGENLDQFTVYVVGTVQEEDCDGLALQYILEESVGPVDYVVLGEATDLQVYRGHRGRMEMNVTATGVSCHGSAPHRGENAIYKMSKLINEIEQLNERLIDDPFLGKGTCAVTFIDCKTPSLCAVPDGCRIHVDRRLTFGEDKELAVKQIKELPSYDEKSMNVEILMYDTPAWTGKVLEVEKYYPTWVLPEEHELTQAGATAAQAALGTEPKISRWVFSTNGVSSMGKLNIPTIGFGPASEVDAHSTNDRVKIDDLVSAAAFYAEMPASILKTKK